MKFIPSQLSHNQKKELRQQKIVQKKIYQYKKITKSKKDLLLLNNQYARVQDITTLKQN